MDTDNKTMDTGNMLHNKARRPKTKTRVYRREDDGKMICVIFRCCTKPHSSVLLVLGVQGGPS